MTRRLLAPFGLGPQLPLTSLATAFLMVSLNLQEGQFRARAEMVRVDVSVHDRQGQPVHGLTAADFLLTEDGKPQQISSFSEITLSSAARSVRTWMDEITSSVASNGSTPAGRLLVIVMDDASVPPDIATIASAKKIG